MPATTAAAPTAAAAATEANKAQAHKIHNWLVRSACACVCMAVVLWLPDKLLCLGCKLHYSFVWQHLLTNLFACCTFRAAASHRIVRCIVLLCALLQMTWPQLQLASTQALVLPLLWFDTQATPLPKGSRSRRGAKGGLARGQRLATCLVGNATRLKNNQF